MTTEAATPAQSATRPVSLLPIWWWIVLGLGLLASFLVSKVEEAAGVIILFVTVMLAALLLLVRHMIRGQGRFMIRALPLLIFMGTMFALAAYVRIDDMRGNLLPTKVSFRWQPTPDERLAAPSEDVATGVDLSIQSDDDFPQFLGPNRDNFINVSLEPNWTENPPELVWFKEEFGAGWSGFAAVNGYAVTMEQRGEDEIVACYEIQSGDLAWATSVKARHATVPGGVGPRSTPTIYNGRVYTLGGTGILLCIDGSKGEILWRKKLQEEIGRTPEQEANEIQWGRAASPLIDEGRVIVPLGGPGGPSLIAFDAVDGTELWRKGNHQISYASPMVTTLDGTRQFVLVCEAHVCGFDANSGDQLWEYAWPGNSAANASCSQPVAIGNDQLFISKGYAHGSAVIHVTRDEQGEWQTKKLWHHLTTMKTKFTNVAVKDGYAYGLDDSILSCVELETGNRVWKRGRYGHGQVLRVGDHLLVQAESGEVALRQLSPNLARAVEVAKFAPLNGKTWNNPCLYGKYLLVRNGQQAACYKLPSPE